MLSHWRNIWKKVSIVEAELLNVGAPGERTSLDASGLRSALVRYFFKVIIVGFYHSFRCSHLHSVWYFAAAYKHYNGPKSNIDDDSVIVTVKIFQPKDKTFCGMNHTGYNHEFNGIKHDSYSIVPISLHSSKTTYYKQSKQLQPRTSVEHDDYTCYRLLVLLPYNILVTYIELPES